MLNPIKWYKKRAANKRYKDEFIYAVKELIASREPMQRGKFYFEKFCARKDAKVFCGLLLHTSLADIEVKRIDLNSYSPNEFEQKVREATTYLKELLNEQDTRIRNT